MATEDIKKATAELMRELQKGEDSAKEKGYIDISDVEKILKANKYVIATLSGGDFLLPLDHCTKTEKSDRETEENHGRIG